MNACLVTALLMSALLVVQGTTTDELFQRYSKMKLLSDCLGEITIARWRQQLITASNECKQNKPFIPALLHQISPATFTTQQKFPPSFFVPNIPPSIQQQSSYLTGQNLRYQKPVTSYKTIYISPASSLRLSPTLQSNILLPTSVRHPVLRQLKPVTTYSFSYGGNKKASSSSEEDDDDIKMVDTLPNRQTAHSMTYMAAKEPAGQKETYTNPNLKYEDTLHYHQRQEVLRKAAQSRANAGPQQTPVLATPYNAHVQKRSAEPDLSGFYQTHTSSNPAVTRSDRMRSMLRSRVSEKVSDMTCVMRAMKMLDENLKPDLRFLKDSLLELPVSDEVYSDLKLGMESCEQESPCRANRPLIDGLPVTGEFSSALHFFRCFGRERLKTCLKNNAEGLVRLLDTQEFPNDPLSGFYNQHQSSSQVSTLSELEDLILGGAGQFVDMLLM